MDIASALALVWQEVDRSSARRVAEKINVPRSALTRWKQGGVPIGEAREKLLAWAESLPARTPVTLEEEFVAAAMERTGANLVRLAEIRGYARSVLAMMRAVTEEQQRVVDALEPYEAAEGRVMVGRITAEDREKIETLYDHIDDEITQPRAERPRASEA